MIEKYNLWYRHTFMRSGWILLRIKQFCIVIYFKKQFITYTNIFACRMTDQSESSIPEWRIVIFKVVSNSFKCGRIIWIHTNTHNISSLIQFCIKFLQDVFGFSHYYITGLFTLNLDHLTVWSCWQSISLLSAEVLYGLKRSENEMNHFTGKTGPWHAVRLDILAHSSLESHIPHKSAPTFLAQSINSLHKIVQSTLLFHCDGKHFKGPHWVKASL